MLLYLDDGYRDNPDSKDDKLYEGLYSGFTAPSTQIPLVTNLAKSDGDGDAPHRVEVPLYEGLNGGYTAL
jgi:hypothetical protein